MSRSAQDCGMVEGWPINKHTQATQHWQPEPPASPLAHIIFDLCGLSSNGRQLARFCQARRVARKPQQRLKRSCALFARSCDAAAARRVPSPSRLDSSRRRERVDSISSPTADDSTTTHCHTPRSLFAETNINSITHNSHSRFDQSRASEQGSTGKRNL